VQVCAVCHAHTHIRASQVDVVNRGMSGYNTRWALQVNHHRHGHSDVWACESHADRREFRASR
jgi:hypothetical protein